MSEDDTEQAKKPHYGDPFELFDKAPLTLRLLRRAALRLGERPIAGIGIRALRRGERGAWKMLRRRLERAGGSIDPLGMERRADHVTHPSDIFAELLQASRGTNQQTIEDDFYVRLLRQLSPSQARMIALMADGSSWPMVHVSAGTLVTEGERVLSFASSVGKEAGVLLRSQVPNFIAHMHSLGLITLGPEDKNAEPAYEVLEADTLVRDALAHIEETLEQRARIERCTIRLSEFGVALCEVALPK